MNDNLDQNEPENSSGKKTESKIIVNNYGASKDDAVVIEEADRTVLLTEDETIIIEKDPAIDIVPKNRPRKIYAGMWGPLEIATVGLGMLAILAVIILVVLVVLPAQKELEQNKAERDRLETALMTARKKYGTITTTEARVAELVASANDFETRFLRVPLIGKTDLYQRLNGLISAYGLTNTTGPDYAPLEIADNNRGQENESERGRAKFQSIFPGIYVTTTVEGSYQNLRRFIREIETSNQFVIISAIELQPSDTEQKGSQPAQQQQASINNVEINPVAPGGVPQAAGFPPIAQSQQPAAAPASGNRGRTRGETVSLRLEMAAYFSRPVAQPAAEAEVTVQ